MIKDSMARELIRHIINNLNINITPDAFLVLYSLKLSLPKKYFGILMSKLVDKINEKNMAILDMRTIKDTMKEIISEIRPATRQTRIQKKYEVKTLEDILTGGEIIPKQDLEPPSQIEKPQQSIGLTETKEKEYKSKEHQTIERSPLNNELAESTISPQVVPQFKTPVEAPKIKKPETEEVSIKTKSEPPKIKVIKTLDWYTISDSIDAFKSYFVSRYKKLRKILTTNIMGKCINTLDIMPGKYEDVYVVIMVDSKKEAKSGRGGIIIGDDEYGRVKVYLPFDRYPELKAKYNRILSDCVIAAKIEAVKDKKFIIAKDIIFPDMPRFRERHRTKKPMKILIAGDLHVGSIAFMDEYFENFIKFLEGKTNNEKLNNLAEEIKYILFVGDLVDGVGVYPQQKNELKIHNQKQQYDALAEYLSRIPTDKKIICIPGNHDASTRIMPQPPISQEVAESLYELSNIEIYSNPATIEIDGVKILMYHGRGLERLAGLLNIPLKEPSKIVTELLRYRHLHPEWGSIALAPTEEDTLVIEEEPDIILTAHLHIYSVGTYRGVAILSPGSFEGLTAWQRDIGITPTIGYFHIMDLNTYEVTTLRATEKTIEHIQTIRI